MLEMVQQWDESILVWIAEHLRNPILSLPLNFYTQLGNHGMLFIILAVILLLFRQTRRAGASAATGMLLGIFVTNLTIKPLVMRPRPWLVIPNFTALVAEHDPNSFPSGHSCCAFAFGVALYLTLPQKWARITAIAAAVIMALSRLYVGVHYPTDVIVGTLIGILCGMAGAWIVKKAESILKNHKSKAA